MRKGLLASALLALSTACAAPAPSPRPSLPQEGRADPAASATPSGVTALDLGIVVYDLGVTETAQLFHIADQVSAWSPFSHKQYARWVEREHLLGPTETNALAAHRALRRRLHYGVLDQTFYTARSIDDALTATALDPADVETERALFRAMTPVVLPLLARERQHVLDVRDAIVAQRDTLTSMLTDLASFSEVYMAKEHVPVWLIATTDPANGGGGYNGGQMVLEAGRSAVHVLMHESLHLVLGRRKEMLAAAARGCGDGLDEMTLEEGIAYALYPGIVGEPGSIPRDLARFAEAGMTADQPYVRFNRLGLALTPIVEKALTGKTKLTALLPEACTAYQRLRKEPWPPPAASH